MPSTISMEPPFVFVPTSKYNKYLNIANTYTVRYKVCHSSDTIVCSSNMATLIDNKKARFDYEFLEHVTAGIELEGHEVKSLRNHRGSLQGAYVTVRGGEAYIMGMNIPPYQVGNTHSSYEPTRPRRLLLKKSEIAALAQHESTKGLTIVPISVYNNRRWIKVDLRIARGKKQRDKRESIKRRDTERDVRRELSDR